MPMKKKQHYVPRFYIKRFANSSAQLDIYLLNDAKTIRNVNYRNQCQESYFYGGDLEWENRLSEMESLWCSLFVKIDRKEKLSEEEIKQLKLFALFQRQRTSGEYNYRYQERFELYKLYGQAVYTKNGWNPDELTDEYIHKQVEQSISPTEMLEFAVDFQDIIDDLEVQVISFETDRKLIISDVPVISINQFHMPSIGYGCVGLVILYPISPTDLVVIYDSKMYKSNPLGQYYVSCNEEDVIELNSLQYVSAEKVLLGDSSSFPTLHDELVKARSNSRNRKTVTKLGTDDNQLWVMGMRLTYYRCKLSFTHINHAFRRIPFKCKDGAPRKWDPEWEKKLKMQGTVLSEICRLSPSSFDGYTCKELRDGCNRFYREMIRYWNSDQGDEK